MCTNKMLPTTIDEMLATEEIFKPYTDRKTVVIFGSARTQPEELIYKRCVDFARRLAQLNYMVTTGGGGGIMQAGHEGAGEPNSFALGIKLPFEELINPVMKHSERTYIHEYFFVRKVAMLKHADAVAVFPGGLGTLDELFEVLTLIQTGKMERIPVVLVDDDDNGMWGPLLDYLNNVLVSRKTIGSTDSNLVYVTTSSKDAVEYINDFYTEQ